MRAFVSGTGLIGASIGAALRATGWIVGGWDPDPDAASQALAMGAFDSVSPEPNFDGHDLVVLAGPVGAIIETVGTLESTGLVTDVAGVKSAVVRAASHLERFIGGHPMAGRESSGPAAASAAMFQGASWILTSDGADDVDVTTMCEIVESLGAVPVIMTAADHDSSIASVSHVPQVVASALVNLVAGDDRALTLAAGGFRDLTRIALSEPAWWADILTENRGEVGLLIRALGSELAEWADRIEAGDGPAVMDALERARTSRRTLAAPVAAVNVLLEDRPGEIARVGQALADSAADVRDLQLRHATRGGGGVLTLSVRPGQERKLRQALESDGFRLVD
ncbi:prephenate dehydrogenase [soil metagenome]